ncbi:spore coat protein T domain protein [Cooperia oncophora]
MNRLLTLLCFIALLVFINAVPVYVPAYYIPHLRPRRQFGFGMPGGFGGGNAYGNSFGFSESESFNAYDQGFNTGFVGL